MTPIVVAGLFFGLGLFLAVRALSGSKTTMLSELLAVENATPQRINVPQALSFEQQLEAWVTRYVAAHPGFAKLIGADLGADLRILGIDRMAHLVQKLVLSLVVFVASPILGMLMAVAWGLPLLAGFGFTIIATTLAFLLPDSGVRRKAAKRRSDFTATMTSYLDLVALRSASGSGVSEALRDASSIGTGYGWLRIRMALADARVAGLAPSQGLVTLGKQLDLPELVDLASQLALVDATGSRTEQTLRAKAQALRAKGRAQLEGDANARSTSMVTGQVLLAFGFLVLLGYPALTSIANM